MNTFRFSYILASCLTMLALGQKVRGQETLTLDRAIQSALENNYGIRVAAYDVEASETDVYRGSTGMLPSVALQGGANYNNNNSRAEIVQGRDPNTGEAVLETVEANGIVTYNTNASLNLNWTVFNGFANARRYELLGASSDLSKEQFRTQVEGSITQVANAYYQLAKLRKSFTIQKESLDRSRARLAYVENQAAFGTTSSLAVLNAKVDVNTDSINLATTELNLDNARRNLNYLIGYNLDDDAAIDLTVELAEIPDLEELEAIVRANNSSIRTAEKSRQLSELNLRIAEAGRYPSLSVNGSYGVNFADNGPFSFAPQIFSYGLSGGVSLNVPIYNGSRVAKGIQQAEISIAQSTAQLTDVQQQVLRDLRNAWFTYQNNRKILELQELSVEAARENFSRTRERFELGQATSIVFRDAQINLLLAENRLNDLLYDVKLSEINLLQITGMLIPEE